MSNNNDGRVAELIVVDYSFNGMKWDGVERGLIPIYPKEILLVGRVTQCKDGTPMFRDPTISNHHLRIHCVVFEEDYKSGILPLIYAEDLSANGSNLHKFNDEAPYSMKKTSAPQSMQKRGALLLDDGDEIALSSTVVVRLESYQPHEDTSYGRKESQRFHDRYVITHRQLGVGGNGRVFAAIHVKSQRQLACKVVDIRRYNVDSAQSEELSSDSSPEHHDHEQSIIPARTDWLKRNIGQQKIRNKRLIKELREFEILKDMDHPNIIKLEKVIMSENTVFIFQELITGGDLFSYLEFKGGSLNDVEAAVVVRQILEAVKYLHDQDIVHRDLKPDNILVTSMDRGARLVLTDFGSAFNIGKHASKSQRSLKRMFSVIGTVEYAAPEIYGRNPLVDEAKGYSKAVDMWSVGTIITALVSGDVIFTNRNRSNFKGKPKKIILHLSANCNLDVLDKSEEWKGVGNRPKDLVRKLLVLDESQRLNVDEALAHPWFTNPLYAAELDAIYERSISSWTPRRKVLNLIERLDASPLGNIGSSSDSASRHFSTTALSRDLLTREANKSHSEQRPHSKSVQDSQATSSTDSMGDSAGVVEELVRGPTPSSRIRIETAYSYIDNLTSVRAEDYGLPRRSSSVLGQSMSNLDISHRQRSQPFEEEEGSTESDNEVRFSEHSHPYAGGDSADVFRESRSYLDDPGSDNGLRHRSSFHPDAGPGARNESLELDLSLDFQTSADKSGDQSYGSALHVDHSMQEIALLEDSNADTFIPETPPFPSNLPHAQSSVQSSISELDRKRAVHFDEDEDNDEDEDDWDRIVGGKAPVQFKRKKIDYDVDIPV
ncbi:kinase-like protein [Aulographum hederae CBS 113979]|uniref:Kinase-like protein n=1 Tax=Aulographum hederae CBS 113979 TaxID=1176131 RepID=A0A6G1GRP7_9PEZI|nr:kinase-like protein [Aulographum hederae CBS 113979]